LDLGRWLEGDYQIAGEKVEQKQDSEQNREPNRDEENDE